MRVAKHNLSPNGAAQRSVIKRAFGIAILPLLIYRANWLGAKLVIKWNEDGARTETWTLAQDGKTLTIIGSAKLTGGGAEKWKYVMVKK